MADTEWIFVKDRLPTDKESELNVLVFDQQEGVHEAEYYNGIFNYPYVGQDISGSFTDVVAWAELPDPPKQN